MLNTSKTINPATRIVFIDAGVENADLLIEGVIPTTEVFVLDGTADGIEQISLVLQHRQNIDAVHIISHGSPGCLYLGNSQLSLDTLNGYATQLQQWDVLPTSSSMAVTLQPEMQEKNLLHDSTN
ncbi:DUF4347 domain-containing protein [Microcoleus sp. Pol12A6]